MRVFLLFALLGLALSQEMERPRLQRLQRAQRLQRMRQILPSNECEQDCMDKLKQDMKEIYQTCIPQCRDSGNKKMFKSCMKDCAMEPGLQSIREHCACWQNCQPQGQQALACPLLEHVQRQMNPATEMDETLCSGFGCGGMGMGMWGWPSFGWGWLADEAEDEETLADAAQINEPTQMTGPSQLNEPAQIDTPAQANPMCGWGGCGGWGNWGWGLGNCGWRMGGCGTGCGFGSCGWGLADDATVQDPSQLENPNMVCGPGGCWMRAPCDPMLQQDPSQLDNPNMVCGPGGCWMRAPCDPAFQPQGMEQTQPMCGPWGCLQAQSSADMSDMVVYHSQRGDTLKRIAQRFGLNPEELKQVNPNLAKMKISKKLNKDQIVYIPTPSQAQMSQTMITDPAQTETSDEDALRWGWGGNRWGWGGNWGWGWPSWGWGWPATSWGWGWPSTSWGWGWPATTSWGWGWPSTFGWNRARWW